MNLLHPFIEGSLSSEMVATLISVLLASAVLNQYTRIGGVAGFVLNAFVLFAGAFGAVYLTRGMDLPLGYFLQRTLLVAFGGILVSSFVVLLLFARSRRE